MEKLEFQRNKFKYVLLIILLVLFIILNLFNFFTPLESKLYDFTIFLKYLINEPEINKVVLVSIDERTIEELGPWPIDRGYYAETLSKLEEAGASSIGLDIILSAQSSISSNEKLLDVFKTQSNIVLPVVANFRKKRISFRQQDYIFDVRYEKPYKYFSEHTNLAHINYPADSDGIIRKIIPELGNERESYNSFAVELVKLSKYRIPQLTRFNLNEELLITFAGPPAIIPTISLIDIIKGNYYSSFFKDKIVVIGFNATGMGDRYMSPFSRYGYMTGSQIHVQTIASILEGSLKTKVSPAFNLLILIIASLISYYLFFRLSPYKAAFIFIFHFIIYTIIYLYLFENNLVIIYISQAFLVLGIYIISIANWYFTVNNEKTAIIDAFKHYLSPDVLQKLLENPSAVALGGRDTELTVIFVDIRDFTPYAQEKLPEEVVKVLNNTFEKITYIIMRNQGTLDKYLGDGVMAFFGAPVKMEDHANIAIKTALEIQQLDLPFELGVGINSGHVIAGNVGSSNRLEYTVIGDVVNKAARFVDIAKPCEIVIGCRTYNALDQEIKSLNWQRNEINIKGSDRKIAVYRLSWVENREGL